MCETLAYKGIKLLAPLTVFKVIRDGYSYGDNLLPCTGPFSHTPITRGKWLEATHEPRSKDMGGVGWRVFLDEKTAEAYKQVVGGGISHLDIVSVEVKGWGRFGDGIIETVHERYVYGFGTNTYTTSDTSTYGQYYCGPTTSTATTTQGKTIVYDRQTLWKGTVLVTQYIKF